MKQETEKTRYSDAELQEFKELLLDKLKSAKEELNSLASSLSTPNANGTDDTAGTYKTLVNIRCVTNPIAVILSNIFFKSFKLIKLHQRNGASAKNCTCHPCACHTFIGFTIIYDGIQLHTRNLI